MNVVDSSAWLEYFANGPNAEDFARAIERTRDLIVPSLTLYEVFKKVLKDTDEERALRAVAAMQQGTVVDLDGPTALLAARIGVERGLPMADSIILATALVHRATVWTQDVDFQGLPNVEYRPKRRAR
jgi:toxin FitB